MTIEADALRWAGIYREPNGSYQTDHSSTPADFDPFPYEEGTLQAQLGRELFDPMSGKMRLDGHDEKVLGPRACTLAMACMLHSHGLDLDGDVTYPTEANWTLFRMLETIMGGVAIGGGTENPGAQTLVVATSTTTTTVDVTATHGSRFAIGGVIACQTVSGSSALELREIASISTDVITVKEAFSAAPTTGTAVRGGPTFFLTENDSTADTSLQALIEGREGSDGVVLRGLQGGMSISVPVGGRGTMSFALAGAGWARMGTSSATIPSYSNVEYMACNPLCLTVPTIGSTTRVPVAASEVNVEPQITYAPQRSGCATETIAKMVRQPMRPVVQGSFVAPYEDDTWYDARDNRTDHAVFVQVGNLAGRAMLISMPTVQITDVQPAASGEGIAGQRVSFEGRLDTEIGSTSEVSYSAFRLHFV